MPDWRRVDLIHGNIYRANDAVYENPGAPPNGSDYIRFRDATDAFLKVQAVDGDRVRRVVRAPACSRSKRRT